MSFFDKITAQLPIGKKTALPEYFFALNITLSEITAAVWEVYDSKVDIIGSKTLVYKGSEDLVEKAYQALDESLGVLEIEPKKILFGVPNAWNLDDNLKEPYLKLLRKLLKDTDLEPLAYVTTTNAISFLLQKQDGIPPTSILISIDDFIEATLLRGGKVIESKATERSDELFESIEKVLSQFTDGEVLPSKILLYSTKSGENLAKIKDKLMEYHWMQHLPFLHFPKIEILEGDVALQAIILAAASEISPDIDFKHSFAIIAPRTTLHGKEDLGFIKGDIKRQQSVEETDEIGVLEDVEKETEVEKKAGLFQRRNFGRFKESTEELEDDNLISTDLPEDFSQTFIDNDIKQPLENNGAVAVIKDKKKLIAFFTNNLKNIKKMNFLPFKKGKLITKLLLVLPILIVPVLAYLFLLKASVSVFVEPRVLEKEAQIVADPKVSSMDEVSKIIPGSFAETTVTGSDKAQSTGKKQIGDPAKGKVTIYNMTSSEVSFSQGSNLISTKGLKFTLDVSVKIASQSSSQGANLQTIITPGKAEGIGITAVAIGPDSNLPASTTDTSTGLSLGNYSKSQVVALITDALSGGTSKDVTVVTSDDQQKLKAKVLDDLRQKAAADLQGKLTGDKKIVSDALTVVDGKYNFNKDINDQAGEFTLNATVRFKGTTYNDTDLKTLLSKLVETNAPDGFALDLTAMETQADVAKVEKDGKLIFNAKFKAKFLPQLDTADLKKRIVGKSVNEVAEKLREVENVVGSEIKFSPQIPTFLARMPILDRNITINVTPK